MKKLIIFIFGILMPFHIGAQPGVYGADLIFNIRNKNKNLKIYHGISEAEGEYCPEGKYHEVNYSKDCNPQGYFIEGVKTPAGGFVSGYLELIQGKDTMRIYHPKIDRSKDIILDSIPFRKGTYKIPKEVYIIHEMFKPEFRKKLTPSLYGDWSEFEVDKEPMKKVYLRRVEIIDNFYRFNCEASDYARNCPVHLQKYFISPQHCEKLLGGFHVPYYYFGVIKKTNLFILQRNEDSSLEYGTIEIPIFYRNISPLQKKYGQIGPKFFVESFAEGSAVPYVLGYYLTLDRESYLKTIWGIFSIYIDPPGEEMMNIIKQEHLEDNDF